MKIQWQACNHKSVTLPYFSCISLHSTCILIECPMSCRAKDVLLVAVPTLFDLIATVLVRLSSHEEQLVCASLNSFIYLHKQSQ